MASQSVLLLVLLAISGFALAQHTNTRYVDFSASSGGNGSAGSPWSTIEEATFQAPDDTLILVKPGTFTGRTSIRGVWSQGITIKSEKRYQAKLRNDAAVVICYYCQNVVFAGFDVAHSGPGASPLVFQIQNLNEDEADRVGKITIKDCVIHDSYNNDLLKINNGARDIKVIGNLFYNQAGSDEHIDINTVEDVLVQDNVFMSDYVGSGRNIGEGTSSYIVIKTSGDGSTADNIRVKKNVFLNWEGGEGAGFLLLGEDGNPFHEAENVLVENNLFLNNGDVRMRSPFGCKGCHKSIFRYNTIVGTAPHNEFGFRLNREGANPQIKEMDFNNNIFSHPGGNMNVFSSATAADVDASTSTLFNNVYWNGGSSIPTRISVLNPSDDPRGRTVNPKLPSAALLVLPRLTNQNKFADGSKTVKQVFENLVRLYGTPDKSSKVYGTARKSGGAPSTDIAGFKRVSSAVGCFSGNPTPKTVRSLAASQITSESAYISWKKPKVGPWTGAEPTCYEIQHRRSGQSWNVIKSCRKKRNWTLEGLASDKNQDVRVRAKNGSEKGKWKTIKFRTD